MQIQTKNPRIYTIVLYIVKINDTTTNEKLHDKNKYDKIKFICILYDYQKKNEIKIWEYRMSFFFVFI